MTPTTCVRATIRAGTRTRCTSISRAFRRVLDSYPGDRMAVGEVWAQVATGWPGTCARTSCNLTFNFQLVQAELVGERVPGRRSTTRCSDAGGGRAVHLGAVQPRRRPSRQPLTAAERWAPRAGALPPCCSCRCPAPSTSTTATSSACRTSTICPDWALQDPTWERSGHTERGRDGERVPLPWEGDTPPFGFSSGPATWLPLPASWRPLTVARQLDEVDSTLSLYRRALDYRAKSATPARRRFRLDRVTG